MARSQIRELQVLDVDFLSEAEHQNTDHYFIDLVDTPSTYENNKYIRSTTSGIEWATISGGSGTSNHSELLELDYVSSGHTGFSPTIHTHLESDISDLDKYTQSEIDTTSGTLNTKIDGKADTIHLHTESDITDLDKYTQAEVDTISGSLSNEIDSDITIHTNNIDAHHNELHAIASHSDTTVSGSELDELTDGSDTLLHIHDNRYYTETETNTISGVLQNEIDTLTYLDLVDTETTYSGQSGKYAVVSADETKLEFSTMEWDPVESPLIPETAISGTYLVNFEGGRLLIGATGNKPDLVYNGPIAGLAFDASKVESCYGIFKIPYAWNTESDISVTINFMTDTTQIGVKACSWRLEYHAYEVGEVYGNKTSTYVNIDTDLPSGAVEGTLLSHNLYMDSDDVNNPLARGDIIPFRFYREGTAVEDTMTGPAVLFNLVFELQVGQNLSEG